MNPLRDDNDKKEDQMFIRDTQKTINALKTAYQRRIFQPHWRKLLSETINDITQYRNSLMKDYRENYDAKVGITNSAPNMPVFADRATVQRTSAGVGSNEHAGLEPEVMGLKAGTFDFNWWTNQSGQVSV